MCAHLPSSAYGSGTSVISVRVATTVLLMPTWTIVDSRFWKAQVGYLEQEVSVLRRKLADSPRQVRALAKKSALNARAELMIGR